MKKNKLSYIMQKMFLRLLNLSSLFIILNYKPKPTT